MNEVTGITLDIDWAPDFMIDAAARTLEDAGVRATWFATHQCAALDRLRARPELFEIGIHPNFLPGSSHGDSREAVVAACLAMVPDATSVRCHGLVQSSGLLNYFIEHTPLTADATVFLPGAAALEVSTYRCAAGAIRRVPFFWEDDVEFYAPHPAWSPRAHCHDGTGLQIFNFHPVHVFLNSHGPQAYETLKRRGADLSRVDVSDTDGLVAEGPGAGSMFAALVQRLGSNGHGVTIRELANAPDDRSPREAGPRAGAVR